MGLGGWGAHSSVSFVFIFHLKLHFLPGVTSINKARIEPYLGLKNATPNLQTPSIPPLPISGHPGHPETMVGPPFDAPRPRPAPAPAATIKFLCSYGGKILPRHPDGKLRYVGGETRVLAVDRSISFSGQSRLPDPRASRPFFSFVDFETSLVFPRTVSILSVSSCLLDASSDCSCVGLR